MFLFLKRAPFVAEGVLLYDLVKNIYNLSKKSNKLIKISENLEKILKDNSDRDMLLNRKKYIIRFEKGIKEVEILQKDLYEEIGEIIESLIKLMPTEYAATAAGTAAGAAASGGVGAPAAAAGSFVLSKVLEEATAAGLGELVEKFVKETIENQKSNDPEIFTEWLTKNDNPNSKALRFIIFITDMLNKIPGSSVLQYIPGGGIFFINNVIRGLLRGASIQNILNKKIIQLKNPNLVYDKSDFYNSKQEIEKPQMTTNEPNQTSKIGSFLRKLFISKPGDKGLFSESLINKKLTYLIEEKDDELDEKDLDEYSGAGAVAIGTLPLGRSTKGSKGNHSSNSGGKSFPYTDKNRKDFKQYTKKTFGGK